MKSKVNQSQEHAGVSTERAAETADAIAGLLPCPWCGGTAVITVFSSSMEPDDDDTFPLHVHCSEDNDCAIHPSICAHSREGAIDKWNARAPVSVVKDSSESADHTPDAELLALLDDIDAAAKKATDGPYYVAPDEAEDCPPHRRSGLALIDTGRSSDWPVARLCEWNTAEFVATVCSAWPTLSRELRSRLASQPPSYIGDAKERLPLCPVHARLDAIGDLESPIGGNNCVACSLNERAELLDLLAPFAAKDGSEDTITVLRWLADFYGTHHGDGRVVVSYPAPSAIPKHDRDCDCGICAYCNGQEDIWGNPSAARRCGHFKPSALGVPQPEDRCVKPSGHEGKHSLPITQATASASALAQPVPDHSPAAQTESVSPPDDAGAGVGLHQTERACTACSLPIRLHGIGSDDNWSCVLAKLRAPESSVVDDKEVEQTKKENT